MYTVSIHTTSTIAEHSRATKKKKKHEELTILPRRLLQPSTLQMKPLPRTPLIIARHHLPIANPIAIAIPRLIIIHINLRALFCRSLHTRPLIHGNRLIVLTRIFNSSLPPFRQHRRRPAIAPRPLLRAIARLATRVTASRVLFATRVSTPRDVRERRGQGRRGLGGAPGAGDDFADCGGFGFGGDDVVVCFFALECRVGGLEAGPAEGAVCCERLWADFWDFVC